MKRTITKILSLVMALLMVGAVLAACGGSKSDDKKDSSDSTEAANTGKTVKIGVLVSDVSGEEAQGFRNYYENYIAKNYNVEFSYTDVLEDAAAEKSAIEKFASQGYDAILSLAASDRAMQIETCAENELYYAVVSGMLDDAQYETYKGNKYFVGQIGPSMQTEYEAGVAMGEFFKNNGAKTIAMYGAFIPNPMHVYRAAGVLKGIGATYGGTDEMGAVVGQIFGDQGIDVSKVGANGVELVSYFQGYGDTTPDELNAAIQKTPDAFISVGMATTFFAQQLNAAKIKFADIDSFTSMNNDSMKNGSLTYLAGKYSSSIGPIFAVVYNAVNGNVIRDADGNALSISQGYRVATSAAEFDELVSKDSGDSPIYSKAVLDGIISNTATFDAVKTLVESN